MLIALLLLGAWPEPSSLQTYTPTAAITRKRRIAIDAGHGAPKNTGALSISCEDEQDFTLRVTRALIPRLKARFEVIETRPPGKLPSYPSRVQQAIAKRADALVSIHFDVRGEAYVSGTKDDGRACLTSDGSTGFAVLWSDEGETQLVSRRHAIARALATSMQRRGFLPYDGADYPGLYDPDAQIAGVFVDRHVPGQRVYMLRKPALPTIILETHQALHAGEWARWQEEATYDALAAALIEALETAIP